MNIPYKAILLHTLVCTPLLCAQKGVVIVPIADLIGQRLCTSTARTTHGLTYDTLPYAAGPLGSLSAALRVHQLLFNEVVEILETNKDEILVSIPQTFYRTAPDRISTRYWAKRNTIVPLDTITMQTSQGTKAIPEPISFADKNSITHRAVITLTEPFHDSRSGMHFSSGTRFVRTPTQKNPKMVTVQLLDWPHKRTITTQIPSEITLATQEMSKRERMNAFVSLIKKWTNPSHGVIPYVWGGCSVATRHRPGSAKTHSRVQENKEVQHFTYHAPTKPYSGIDCTGLVLRAAQICGIPYFCKNSATLAQTLEPLKKNEKLEEGDLIWIPGHVLVVGDLNQNSIFESRHYIEGFGWVHELPLHRSFEGVHTYAQLVSNFHAGTPLKRLHRDGKVVKTFPNYKLLKMRSVWDTTTA